MKPTNLSLESLARLLLMLALVAVFLSAGGGWAQALPSRAGSAQLTDLTSLQVWYKLDPRLTSGVYMGERWVSPPMYDLAVPEGTPYLLEARVEGKDAGGHTVLAEAQWTAEDSEMLTITPAADKEVMILVNHAGQSSLQVSSQGVTETIYIEAAGYLCTALRLRVSKVEPAEKLSQAATCSVHLPIMMRR